ncbi:GNAT family acetyltransferase [Colwellia sp. MT41]|uniref:GNAT family N-acetyltransferase n=1 Tax=Colwellia sp. MT41 TaxID=58049 RepID=UPI000717ABED|nr:GNAT family protein [Colwellia sp. MT41]ALO34518.1 GNAT family acetyltransferase [Colwellia sp. MT41]
MSFPTLETNRLRLDQLSKEDSNSLFEIFSDNSVVEYYDLEAFTELSQASNLIEFFNSRFKENSGIRWAIRLKETNQLIGTCGFNTWSPKMKNAVLGYDLLPKYWGKGFTTEAVHRIVKSAFSGDLSCGKLNRIQGDTVPGNSASESLLLKVGFKEEGIRRQSGYWKNQFHDLKCFGLIQSEYCEI